MGLYYRAFLKSMTEAFSQNNQNVEEFLKSKKVQNIYDEFEIGEGSIHWALNMTEFFRQVKINDSKTLIKAKEILKEEYQNENGMF